MFKIDSQYVYALAKKEGRKYIIIFLLPLFFQVCTRQRLQIYKLGRIRDYAKLGEQAFYPKHDLTLLYSIMLLYASLYFLLIEIPNPSKSG